MIFDQLAINNYGVYKGEQIFDLSTNKKKPIVLIGALNVGFWSIIINTIEKIFNLFKLTK